LNGALEASALGDNIFFSPNPSAGKVAFVFPGSGAISQVWAGVGSGLAGSIPAAGRGNERLHDQYLPDLFWAETDLEILNQDCLALMQGR
jgi:hypothetical protein